MNILQIRLNQIKQNLELAKPYAGRIRGKQFYTCKKCSGGGYLQYDMPPRIELCKCVVNNLRREIEGEQSG